MTLILINEGKNGNRSYASAIENFMTGKREERRVISLKKAKAIIGANEADMIEDTHNYKTFSYRIK